MSISLAVVLLAGPLFISRLVWWLIVRGREARR